MTKQFVIQWKSKLNGRVGRGSKKFEEQEALDLVAELNADYPDIQHEAVAAEADDLPTPPLVEATPSENASLQPESSPAPSRPVSTLD